MYTTSFDSQIPTLSGPSASPGDEGGPVTPGDEGRPLASRAAPTRGKGDCRLGEGARTGFRKPRRQ